MPKPPHHVYIYGEAGRTGWEGKIWEQEAVFALS